MECEYCKKTFKTKGNLTSHQKNAKYCLSLRLNSKSTEEKEIPPLEKTKKEEQELPSLEPVLKKDLEDVKVDTLSSPRSMTREEIVAEIRKLNIDLAEDPFKEVQPSERIYKSPENHQKNLDLENKVILYAESTINNGDGEDTKLIAQLMNLMRREYLTQTETDYIFRSISNMDNYTRLKFINKSLLSRTLYYQNMADTIARKLLATLVIEDDMIKELICQNLTIQTLTKEKIKKILDEKMTFDFFFLKPSYMAYFFAKEVFRSEEKKKFWYYANRCLFFLYDENKIVKDVYPYHILRLFKDPYEERCNDLLKEFIRKCHIAKVRELREDEITPEEKEIGAPFNEDGLRFVVKNYNRIIDLPNNLEFFTHLCHNLGENEKDEREEKE